MTAAKSNRVLTHLHRLALRQDRAAVTDAQLLERFLSRREEVAFEELVRRHGPMVLGVCTRVLGDAHAAEDAFQATFLILVRRAGAVVPRSCVAPWLYGVARRTALKARSAVARRRRAERQAARGRSDAAPPADTSGELRPLLDEELGRLPEKYSAPLVLCLLEGKSRREAAALLGWGEGTLSGRLARAKEVLGKRLLRRGVAPPAAAALAGALVESAAPAAVHGSLAAATVRAAASLTGQAAAHAVSAPVVALMEEVMQAMLTSKLKAVAGVLVLAAGIGLGVASIAWQHGPTARAEAPASEAAAASGKAAAAAEKGKEANPRDYVIEPPDLLLVKYVLRGSDDPVKIDGQRLVRPDGTIGLGQLGAVFVSGRTLEEARGAISGHLARRLDGFDPEKLTVEVVAYNSKVIYVITDGADGAEQVYRLPATGSQAVLDVLGDTNVAALVGVGRKHISIRRSSAGGRGSQVLPVDWKAITERGETSTNYQILPGDRVIISSAAPGEAVNRAADDEDQAAVRKHAEQYVGALLRGEKDTLNALVHERYEGRSLPGASKLVKGDKVKAIAHWTDPGSTFTRLVGKVDSVRVFGDTAIESGTLSANRTEYGSNSVWSGLAYTRVWLREAKGWRLVHEQY
jgi:RNA polymerase sigma factor (sigma-70 family)